MKTDSFKQNMNLLNILNESETLTEKINKDNLEINNKILRALRSKGEARKLEPELAKHGIKVNYDYSQGTTMVGPNGKRLSDDKNHVYGPSQAGFNKTHAKTDRSYERWSKDYGNKAEEYELKLKQLKNMDRDDIIRKYNDKSTEEALKAHQAEIERTEKWAKDYRDNEKKYANDDLKARQNARKTRRIGHKNDPRSSYSDPINKTDAPEKYNRETRKYEKSGMSSADKVDYLTYLTKKPTGYRKTGDTYKSGSEYDPADNMNKKLNGYKDLKYDEKRAKEHLDFKNKYYKVKSDDELKADADKMRAEVEAKIKAAQEENEKNKKSTADAEAGVQAAKKNIQDYMKKVREERIRNSKNKRESEESFINHKINESAKAKKAKLLESIKARKQSIINEAAADNKYHSKSINDYEDSSELTSAINDDMSTIDNTLNELKYRVNLNETISLIDSYKDQLLQAVSDLNSTKELTETSDRELEDMEKNLRAEEVQALKDAGDKYPENTVGIAKRLPEEVWKKLKIKGDTLSAIQMIHSILAYSAEDGRTVDNIMDNRYMKSYINSLGEDTVRDLVEKELADFKERATVVNDVYTDSEGVSYNSINWKN